VVNSNVPDGFAITCRVSVVNAVTSALLWYERENATLEHLLPDAALIVYRARTRHPSSKLGFFLLP
jgi:hypothetical protein